MPAPRWAVCVDIGSTFTKGAVFGFEGGEGRIAARAEAPTTPGDLARGFEAVRRELFARARANEPGFAAEDAIVRFSSSARGGLRIAAIGIVPDLTLAVARLAAASAGGKIVKSFAYTLTADDVAALETLDPDIVLLTGGTDGGDEKHNLANAAALAGARISSTIIYAGNRTARDAVAGILAGKRCIAVDNVMPEVGAVRVEPAREAIRRVFLDTIVEGKGLAALVDSLGVAPKPTPLAVFELVRALSEECPEWRDVCLLDIGGATTDCYSAVEPFRGEPSVVLHGIREPRLTRTVEGDCGLRVSAEALFESGRALIERELGSPPLEILAFAVYIGLVARYPAYLAAEARETRFDAIMARTCAALALRRHAGVLRTVYTAGGKAWVQRGKDLRAVRRVIGTGGYLARIAEEDFLARALAALVPEPEERFLVPEAPVLYADRNHVVPLIGSLAAEYPREAARLLARSLRPVAGDVAQERNRRP
ncbi:MAG TPA: glutamate mutase [Planctomycetes bacterium]|nr:glutamate mutase [Planctomycetota bacterium]